VDVADIVRPVPVEALEAVASGIGGGPPQVVVAGFDVGGADDVLAQSALRLRPLDQLVGGVAVRVDRGQRELDPVDRSAHAYPESTGGIGLGHAGPVDVGEQEPFGHAVGGV